MTDAFVPFPTFCVNREKYSVPEDVIRAHPSFGIAAFAVQDIPPALNNGSELYEFGIEHKPEPDNHAHTEIHAFRESQKAEPPKAIRKKFRELLRQRLVVLKEPEPVGP